MRQKRDLMAESDVLVLIPARMASSRLPASRSPTLAAGR
jgi:hypothetical protein